MLQFLDGSFGFDVRFENRHDGIVLVIMFVLSILFLLPATH